MNMNENANFIEILRMLGWTGDQINDFMLGIEGRISMEEAARRITSNSEKERNNG